MTYHPIKDNLQATAMSVLLYDCTTLTLMKCLEEKLDWKYTAVLNKSWKQHLSKQQLYGHLPPISQTMLVKMSKKCWRSKSKLISDIFL